MSYADRMVKNQTSTALSGGNQAKIAADRAPAFGLPQERIISAAREMFCRDGIHATGIDRILATASASKVALYSHFGSKAGLLREVLLREGQDWRQGFFAAVTAATPAATGPLPYLVAGLGRMFQSGTFYGCALMNAVAEHTKGETWLRELAADHHRQILDVLRGHAAAAGYFEPAITARQSLLLLDGAIAALMVTGDAAVLDIAERNLHAILRRD